MFWGPLILKNLQQFNIKIQKNSITKASCFKAFCRWLLLRGRRKSKRVSGDFINAISIFCPVFPPQSFPKFLLFTEKTPKVWLCPKKDIFIWNFGIGNDSDSWKSKHKAFAETQTKKLMRNDPSPLLYWRREVLEAEGESEPLKNLGGSHSCMFRWEQTWDGLNFGRLCLCRLWWRWKVTEQKREKEVRVVS